MKINTRCMLGMSTEMVSISHRGTEYTVLLTPEACGGPEVLRPDCTALRCDSQLAKSLVTFAQAAR
jgi:hypothetical protein